jgi:hypothetical protein
MINHMSIGVNNPEKVANILAELWGGVAMPFPPSPGGFVALADDGKGTIVEFVPADVQLVPGTGYPDEATFTKETLTADYEATFVPGNETSLFGSVHLNINSPHNEETIKAIAKTRRLALFHREPRRRHLSVDRAVDRKSVFARSKYSRDDRGISIDGQPEKLGKISRNAASAEICKELLAGSSRRYRLIDTNSLVSMGRAKRTAFFLQFLFAND